MTADIVIAPYNQAYCYVWCPESIERELSDEFSFAVPGAQYMKKFRRGWNGHIRLYNRTTKLIYAGLAQKIMTWAKKRGYSVENRLPASTSGWTALQTEALINAHPVPFDVRSYQKDAITHALHQQRCVILSPTASGKSLVLYYMVRARMSHGPVLLVVPNISLVTQMLEDWRGYGWNTVEDSVHIIMGGRPKDTEKPVVISTWQSIFKQPEKWFSRYQTIFGDEAHLFKAESLRDIMGKLPDCAVRIGVTGTLDDAKSNKLMVEGAFGPAHRVAKTADLQKIGHLTPIKIQGHVLEYSDYERWFVREHKRNYRDEVDYFIQHSGRMDWLVNFVGQLPGNVLVLFTFVEKHGKPLFEKMKAHVQGTRPVYYVSGGVSAESRERVRNLLEQPEHILLTFGEKYVRCVPTELVPLTNGDSKPASDITTDDDVADSWILNNEG